MAATPILVLSSRGVHSGPWDLLLSPWGEQFAFEVVARVGPNLQGQTRGLSRQRRRRSHFWAVQRYFVLPRVRLALGQSALRALPSAAATHSKSPKQNSGTSPPPESSDSAKAQRTDTTRPPRSARQPRCI